MYRFLCVIHQAAHARDSLITRPSFQEETGIVLVLVFPSSSNPPLVFKAHACAGGLSRDRFLA